MAVSGEHQPLDGSLSHELTSKTPFPSLKLYFLIGILSLCALSIALLIYLCVRLSRTSKKRRTLAKGANSRASSGPSYEVFLSFRGPDTRYGFTDCLYHDMVDVGILVFRDEESLHFGKRISDELPQAIENCKIYIPIFSKNYAESHWCLEELAYMVDCKSKSNGNKEILPIFLDAKPDDVKLKTKLYSKALSKHRKKFCTEAVDSWKKALIEVAEIKGWNLKKGDGQGDLIRKVIQKVSVKLKVAHENVTEQLVGVDDRVEDIIKVLDVGSDGVRFLKIHGMGGVGKTTLAKVVFNRLSSSFDRCCFLADIRESSKVNDGPLNLQKQLLSKLVGPHSINQIYHVNDGINMLNRGVLGDKKVLIILDDVDEKEQLKSLAEKGDWFGSGSAIILTTRDERVLTEGPNVLTYEVCEMKFNHALELFSRHAFRRDYPPDHRVSLSKEIVRTLGQLPLALEITGSSLSGKSEKIWVDTLQKLEEAPPMGVQKKLMVSYERLDHAQKQVFLDIACFFVGRDKTYPLYMWDDCGYHPHDSLEVLVLMSLIKIKDNNTFWMHDQVQDLGREIVRQENFNDPCEHSRVWKHEEALSILKRKEGSRNIEALSVETCGSYSFGREILTHDEDEFANLQNLRFSWRDDVSIEILTHDGFANLQNLRFFQGYDVSIVGDFNNLLFNLRWLSWHCDNSKFETTNFHPTNLVVLNLSYSGISEEWIGWDQIKEAKKLKVLDLSYCKSLKRTPDLSTWVSLERLVFKWCSNLIEINSSIGKLKLLTSLNLGGCGSLRELPKEIGSLQALTEIVMPNRLHELPETFGNLQSLLTLDVSYRQINKLPYSIGGLVKLTQLDLSSIYIEELPDSIGKLQSLVELDLSCTRIRHLPDSIGNLKQLKVLRMRCIEGITELSCIEELPYSVGKLQSLVELDLSETRIRHLPDSIGNLKQLKVLRISGIEGIIDLSCIEELPDSVGKLQLLVELDLLWTRICHLPDSIGNLKQLKVLRMRGIRGLTKLPSAIGLVEKLEELDAQGCCNLTGEIPEEIGRLSRLRILDLSNTRIFGLPTTLSHLSNLQILKLEECPELKQLPELPPSLTWLIWIPFYSLLFPSRIGALSQQGTLATALPTSIGTLSQLKTLSLSCKYVQFLPRLPSSLRELRLQDLVTTRSPDFSNLKNLSILEFHQCSLKLSSVFDAESEELHVKRCKLRKLDSPSQPEMKRLRLLQMAGCEFPPAEVLDLSRMKNLCEVSLIYCLSLVEVRGLEELGSLGSLTVVQCPSLKRMSDRSKLKELRTLEVRDCGKLKRVQGLKHLGPLKERTIFGNGEFEGDTYQSSVASASAVVSRSPIGGSDS